ncbi:proteinase-activated receptor 3 isoform X2 [Myripristis murdjan]|uniref:proteinase-activated receptor 3 isoform X2 n=1 Tax=Myripristis murdjan TaxID=586833 RepID=UPI00117644C2|nr:proteinase-activated receptor 3-like isoform X2 [Myripristis murdjan]
MGKPLLFFLLLFLFVDGILQEKVKRRRQIKRNNTEKAVPRTFKGDLVLTQTKFISALNGTQAPYSSVPSPHTPPALRLLSNSTAGYLSGPLSTRVIPAIYILAVAVGIPANVAILCALATKIRKVSSAVLYCSLALSDLLLLVSLIFKAHYHLHGNHWGLGEIACRVVTACFYGNLYCSAQTLACISVKRYLAVVHPFLYKRLPKRMFSAWTSLVVWLVFGAAIIPELLVQQSYQIPQLGITTCHDVLPLDYSSHIPLLYYNLTLTILGLLLPLVVTSVCYIRIVHELSRSHHDWAMYIKVSSLVFTIFLLCFTPAGVLNFLHYARLFVDGEESFYAHFNMAVCLCCFHSCLDPFLFFLMSKSAGSRPYFMTFKGKTLSIST